ncbi:hypothetical protein KY320_01550 [Candidatus Woesearchaeota archaeon]|nr:hypothetical protein [Candidatus Woesearchaeota archaeon]
MKVNHTRLRRSIQRHYQTKIPLFITGTIGIGKSQHLKQFGIDTAAKEGREFFEWNKATDEFKRQLVKDAELRKKHFCFVDVRMAIQSPEDMKGLPTIFSAQEYVEWKAALLFRYLSSEGAMGLLFFDEMNQAFGSVQAQAYQIILDKCIGEIALSPDIAIYAAGNAQDDKSNVNGMALALMNRFCHITLMVPDIKEWVDWAIEAGVDDRIIAYLQFRPVHLMADLNKITQYESQAFATPRSWEFLSIQIEGITDNDDLKMFASECVGDAVAGEFSAWLKLKEKIDLDKILDHPEQAKQLDLQMTWCLISAVSEKYRADKKILEKAVDLTMHVEPDFSASLLRMLKRQDKKHFLTNMPKCKNFKDIAQKYSKFVI